MTDNDTLLDCAQLILLAFVLRFGCKGAVHVSDISYAISRNEMWCGYTSRSSEGTTRTEIYCSVNGLVPPIKS